MHRGSPLCTLAFLAACCLLVDVASSAQQRQKSKQQPEAAGAPGNPTSIVSLLDQTQEATVTGAAQVYKQLGSLGDEFAQIREDDASHVARILGHVNLREELRKKLALVQQTLRDDNELLTSEAGKVHPQTPANETGLPVDQLSFLNTGSKRTRLHRGEVQDEVAGFLAKHASDSGIALVAITAEEEQLANRAVASLDTLEQQLAEVRKRDEEEVSALRANAHDRQSLKAVIGKQQAQLSSDMSLLGDSLEKIVLLATPPTPPPAPELSTASVATAEEAAPVSAAPVPTVGADGAGTLAEAGATTAGAPMEEYQSSSQSDRDLGYGA